MKLGKVITIVLALMLVLSLAACGGNSVGNTTTTPPATPSVSPSASTATPEKTPEATPDLTSAQVGDVIQFGKLDWLVLAVKDGKALILLENILGEGSHNEDGYPHCAFSRF